MPKSVNFTTLHTNPSCEHVNFRNELFLSKYLTSNQVLNINNLKLPLITDKSISFSVNMKTKNSIVKQPGNLKEFVFFKHKVCRYWLINQHAPDLYIKKTAFSKLIGISYRSKFKSIEKLLVKNRTKFKKSYVNLYQDDMIKNNSRSLTLHSTFINFEKELNSRRWSFLGTTPLKFLNHLSPNLIFKYYNRHQIYPINKLSYFNNRLKACRDNIISILIKNQRNSGDDLLDNVLKYKIKLKYLRRTRLLTQTRFKYDFEAVYARPYSFVTKNRFKTSIRSYAKHFLMYSLLGFFKSCRKHRYNSMVNHNKFKWSSRVTSLKTVRLRKTTSSGSPIPKTGVNWKKYLKKMKKWKKYLTVSRKLNHCWSHSNLVSYVINRRRKKAVFKRFKRSKYAQIYSNNWLYDYTRSKFKFLATSIKLIKFLSLASNLLESLVALNLVRKLKKTQLIYSDLTRSNNVELKSESFLRKLVSQVDSKQPRRRSTLKKLKSLRTFYKTVRTNFFKRLGKLKLYQRKKPQPDTFHFININKFNTSSTSVRKSNINIVTKHLTLFSYKTKPSLVLLNYLTKLTRKYRIKQVISGVSKILPVLKKSNKLKLSQKWKRLELSRKHNSQRSKKLKLSQKHNSQKHNSRKHNKLKFFENMFLKKKKNLKIRRARRLHRLLIPTKVIKKGMQTRLSIAKVRKKFANPRRANSNTFKAKQVRNVKHALNINFLKKASLPTIIRSFKVISDKLRTTTLSLGKPTYSITDKLFNAICKKRSSGYKLQLYIINRTRIIGNSVNHFLKFKTHSLIAKSLVNSSTNTLLNNTFFSSFRRSFFINNKYRTSHRLKKSANIHSNFFFWISKNIWRNRRVDLITNYTQTVIKKSFIAYKPLFSRNASAWFLLKSLTLSLRKKSKAVSTDLLVGLRNYLRRPFFLAKSRCTFVFGVYGFYAIILSKKYAAHLSINKRLVFKQVFSFINARSTKKIILRKFTRFKYKHAAMYQPRSMRNSSGFNLYTVRNTLLRFYKDVNKAVISRTKKTVFSDSRLMKAHRVARIKFKPGYSRIWRRARSSFKRIMFLKFKYQHRLTTYLHKFERPHYSSNYCKNVSLVSLHTLLVRSRFAVDTFWGSELLSNDFVYLNSFLVTNPDTVLVKGDLLQLLVHVKYYIVFKWQKNLTIIKKARLQKFAKIKFKPKTSRVGADRNYTYPDWILTLKFLESDVPSYVELDYFTLSLFLIYNPFMVSHSYNYNEEIPVPRVSRLYNWKYIT